MADDKLQRIRAFFEKEDTYAALSGINVLDIGEGYAKTSMKVTGDHLNGVKSVHGGAIFTLADFAFAIAANSHGRISVAINASISFFKGAPEGEMLYAEAEEISDHPKLGSYVVRVTDGVGALVAQFQGMVYRKRDEVPLDRSALPQ